MSVSKVGSADKETFAREGYLLIRSFFNREEIEKVFGRAQEDAIIEKNTYDRQDKEGLRTKLALWYSLDDSIYSLMARCERVVSGVQLLLGGEPAHFHSKLMRKDPKVGGAWEWHQDYGYWYRDGFLFPHMVSVLTALTPATKANGCLQIVPGSHLLGRIEHGFAGEQVGADIDRVEEAIRRMGLIHVEMNPGDTIIFHCNLLHRSDRNRSDSARWSMISAYNLITNRPFRGEFPSCCTSIKMVPDTAIAASPAKGIAETADFKHK